MPPRNAFAALASESPACSPQASPVMRPTQPVFFPGHNVQPQQRTAYVQPQQRTAYVVKQAPVLPEVQPFPSLATTSMSSSIGPTLSVGSQRMEVLTPAALSNPAVSTNLTSALEQMRSDQVEVSRSRAGSIMSNLDIGIGETVTRSRAGSTFSDTGTLDLRTRAKVLGGGIQELRTTPQTQQRSLMTPPTSGQRPLLAVPQSPVAGPSSPKWTMVAAPKKGPKPMAPPPMSLGMAATAVAQPTVAPGSNGYSIYRTSPVTMVAEGSVDDMYYEQVACGSQRSHNRSMKQTWSTKGQRNINYQVEKRSNQAKGLSEKS